MKKRVSINVYKATLIIITCTFILVVSYFISIENYLLFHSLAEIFSIIVACVIFTVAWNLRNKISNNYILFLGNAFIFIAFLEILHTLSYRGINIFLNYPGANLATQLWISARYMECLTLLIAPYYVNRKLNQQLIISIYSIISILILLSIFSWNIFPACYNESTGLTNFKIYSEYIISGIYLLSIFTLLLKKVYIDKVVLNLLLFAIILKIFSEISFTAYVSVYGFMNFIGHTFGIISYYLIYLALISTGLKKPFDLLFRELQHKNKEYKNEIEFIKAVIDVADVLVLVLNTKGRILLFNRTCQNITGYSFEDIKDKPFWDYFITEDELGDIRKVFEDLKCGTFPNHHKNYWRMKDGSLKLISWANTVILDRTKNVDYIVSIGLDITEITSLERENRNIISVIAHDMKSPLLSVRLFANQLIKKWQKLNPEKQKEYLNIICKEGERLNSLIDEFLEFSLVQHGLISLSFKPVNPSDLITGIYDIYKIKAKDKGIKLNMECSINDEVLGDPSRLRRVLTNLLDNAIKFSEKNDHIDIYAGKEDSFLKIEIIDSGIGIPDEELPKIFLPYTRGRQAANKEGYGVGLAYVKTIIDKHNGKILVDSKLGKGTRFKILLPLLGRDTIVSLGTNKVN